MTDFTSPSDPFQTPLGAAIPQYASIAPSTGDVLGAMAGATSRRAGQLLTTGLGQYPEYFAEVNAGQTGIYDAPTDPLLPADEINKRYGTEGAPITSKPMTEAAGRLLGEAHTAQMTRDALIARYEGAHSLPTNFAIGTVGFLLDPLGASTALIPGVGEEAILARLGGGPVARVAARLGAGATAGAAATAPIAALEYATDPDYTLRSAFKDMFFGAAGNAIFHAGFGALKDHFTAPVGAPPPELRGIAPTEAAPLLNADAATKQAAMGSGVAQLLDGRQIDVTSYFPAPATESAIGLVQRELGPPEITVRPEGLGADVADGQAKLEKSNIFARDAVQRALADPEFFNALSEDFVDPGDITSNDYPRLRILVDQFLSERENPVSGIEDLREKLSEYDEALRQQNIANENTRAPVNSGPAAIGDLAQQQREIYASGYAPGIPQPEFLAGWNEIYGPKEPAAQANAVRPAAAEGPGAKPAGEAATVDPEIAAAQTLLEATGLPVHPEDAAELAAGDRAMEDATGLQAAYDEAATCLVATGGL